MIIDNSSWENIDINWEDEEFNWEDVMFVKVSYILDINNETLTDTMTIEHPLNVIANNELYIIDDNGNPIIPPIIPSIPIDINYNIPSTITLQINNELFSEDDEILNPPIIPIIPIPIDINYTSPNNITIDVENINII